MKNALLMVAVMGMFSGALAAKDSDSPVEIISTTTQQKTTVIQPVSATVNNVCTYAVPDMSDVNGKTFTQANKVLGNSDALNDTSASVAMGQFYIFRCTTGTNWDSSAYSKTGDITLKGTAGSSNSSSTLMATYKINVENTSGSDGDIHKAGVDFKIPKGQWTSKAGSYSGELKVVISYN